MCAKVTYLPSDIASFIAYLNIDETSKNKLKLFAEKIENSGYYLQYQKAPRKKGWGCIPVDNFSIIQYHPTNHNVNYVAHEFFHAAYFKNGFLKPENLLNDILVKLKYLGHIPPEFHVDFINNLQHYKFYSQYINDGYAESDFVENRNERQVKWLYFIASILKMKRNEAGFFIFLKLSVELKCYWNPKFKTDYKAKAFILRLKKSSAFSIIRKAI